MKLTPAERQRRSDLARQLHAEGRLGGRGPARKSAEARARRASELSAEIVAKHRAKIERAIVAGLESSSTAQRLKAAELALKMGMRAEQIDSTDHRAAVEHLDRQELIDRLAHALSGGSASAPLVASRVAELSSPAVVDGHAVELRSP